MDKKQNIPVGFLFLLCSFLLTVTACRNNEDLPEETDPDGTSKEISFTFNIANEPETRSTVNGSGNVQHVQHVQLYIFNGTGANAPCIASENVNWEEHFNNSLPTTSAQMTYKVKYKNFQAGTTYTFLAVGLDDQAGATYGFPGAISAGTSSPTILGNATAVLSSGSTWGTLATAELFAGYTTLTAGTYGFSGQIDLYRRVAGIKGWFTNVPSTLGGKNVSGVRVSLYTQQNNSVPLIKQLQKPVFKDYILSPATSTAESKVLFTLAAPGSTSTVISKGVYILPTPAPPATGSNDYTVIIELTASDGSVLRSTRVKLSAGDSLDPSTSSGTGIIDSEADYRFPIIANHFYSIGSSTKAIDLGVAP